MESPTDRQERISWWRQDVLRRAKVAVIGAGALGNEVLKNLALLGVGELHLFDFDTIEISNLSRTLLFRPEDAGRHASKAVVAAERLRSLHVGEDPVIVGHHMDVVWDLGGGFLRQMDLVMGCLDNVEARLAVARHCYQFSRPFIDGGIRELDGCVQLHRTGTGACFDCTIGNREREQLRARYSCESVMRSHMESGFVPTVQITSALVAALMSQEAVRSLHGLAVPFGRVLSWLGGSLDFESLEMQRNPECFTCSVPPVEDVRDLPLTARNTAQALVDMLPDGWEVILPSPFILAVRCDEGRRVMPVGKPSHRCFEDELVCADGGDNEAIDLETVDRLSAETPAGMLSQTLADLGIAGHATLYAEGPEGRALLVLRGV